MAASRIERFSSIVRRCEGLMKGGVMKKKPIWYDVYKKFPPFIEPTVQRDKPDLEIKEIFYAEDINRAEEMNSTSYSSLSSQLKTKNIKKDVYLSNKSDIK